MTCGILTGRAVEAGMNPLTLAKLMGHADLKTTMRYVHLLEAAFGRSSKAHGGVPGDARDRGCGTESHISIEIGTDGTVEKLNN